MNGLSAAARIVLETLHEIFDENAYARFLARSGSAASRESYLAFLREVEVTSAQRPRCC
jgi:hypothetical protein